MPGVISSESDQGAVEMPSDTPSPSDCGSLEESVAYPEGMLASEVTAAVGANRCGGPGQERHVSV